MATTCRYFLAPQSSDPRSMPYFGVRAKADWCPIIASMTARVLLTVRPMPIDIRNGMWRSRARQSGYSSRCETT